MVSVIIPVYNQAHKLKGCLKSLLEQTFFRYEVIIVDDGSRDNLKETIEVFKKKFQEKKINFQVIHQENRGASAARNRGFLACRGQYLLFLDADIVMKPEMLEKMVSVLEDNPQKAYVYSSFYFGRKLFRLGPFSKSRLREMPYIHTSSLLRREFFPGFDESLKRFQDWDLWLAVLEKGGEGVWIKEPLFKINPGGTMSSWLPKIFYKIFPFLPAVKAYKEAERRIKEKHSLL